MLSDLSPILQLSLLYMGVINMLTFVFFGLDKTMAVSRGGFRIAEKTLWLLSVLGGSVGGFLGMHLFRHKTKKLSFQLVMLLIVCAHIGIGYICYVFFR